MARRKRYRAPPLPDAVPDTPKPEGVEDPNDFESAQDYPDPEEFQWMDEEY